MDTCTGKSANNESDVLTVVYRNHPVAEAAITLLAAGDIPTKAALRVNIE